MTKFQVFYTPAGRAAEYSEWAVNLYLTCNHGCKYCYVPQFIKKRAEDFFVLDDARRDIVSKIRRDLLVADAVGFKERILQCFTCDPWQNVSDGVARAVIEAFHEFKHPFTILTKSFVPDFIDMLDVSRDHYAASLTFASDRDSLRWEPNGKLPHERLSGLRRAKERGVFTWASLEPVIDPDQSLEMIKRSIGFVDHYKVGAVSQVALQKRVDWASFYKEVKDIFHRHSTVSYYIKSELERLSIKQ